MPRRESEQLTQHNIFLFQGDYAKLQAIYGDKVPASRVVRTLVRNLLKKIEAKKDEVSQPIQADLSEEDLKVDAGTSNH